MLISVFNYICLIGCSPPEMLRCWHVGGLVKLFTFAPQTENFTSLFSLGFPFVSFYKIAEPVTQQIRNCPCKAKTATTGRQPVVIVLNVT